MSASIAPTGPASSCLLPNRSSMRKHKKWSIGAALIVVLGATLGVLGQPQPAEAFTPTTHLIAFVRGVKASDGTWPCGTSTCRSSLWVGVPYGTGGCNGTNHGVMTYEYVTGQTSQTGDCTPRVSSL